MTVDWTKPIEAVRETDGKVVAMEFQWVSEDGIHYTKNYPNPEESNWAWHRDGSDFCHLRKWRIRNVVEEIPDWAIERAIPRPPNADYSGSKPWPVGDVRSDAKEKVPYACALMQLASYIAKYEQPPVDPMVLEARRIVECSVRWSPQTDRDLASGKNDDTPEIKIALAALRRGIEIGKDQK